MRGDKVTLTRWFYLWVDETNDIYRAINIPCKPMSEVRSIANGSVIGSGYTPIEGIFVIIGDKKGFEAQYSHLNNWAVKTGDIVRAGDIIGYAGRTGRTNGGSHLRLIARYKGEPVCVSAIDLDTGVSKFFGVKWHCHGDGQVRNPIIK
jgi:murein DD-endopeptidase MepM/ murein hydrolase activator NlpD